MTRMPMLLRTVVALAVSTLTAAGAAHADSFLRHGDGWQTYINTRYGTRLDFPADLFAPGIPPENGDGLQFRSPNASFEVYAFQNMEGDTAQTLRERLLGREGYTNVTYSPSGYNWFVLSGVRGHAIFYEKYLFRDAIVHAFGMEYPGDSKARYAPILERMEDSFRAE